VFRAEKKPHKKVVSVGDKPDIYMEFIQKINMDSFMIWVKFYACSFGV